MRCALLCVTRFVICVLCFAHCVLRFVLRFVVATATPNATITTDTKTQFVFGVCVLYSVFCVLCFVFCVLCCVFVFLRFPQRSGERIERRAASPILLLCRRIACELVIRYMYEGVVAATKCEVAGGGLGFGDSRGTGPTGPQGTPKGPSFFGSFRLKVIFFFQTQTLYPQPNSTFALS